MAKLKIDKVCYRYPNLLLSINDLTVLIRVKPGRGKKWLKWRMIDSVFAYPTIENDTKETKFPIRSLEKFIISVLSNFPTISTTTITNEPARDFIWKWRQNKLV
jgi:hypothetical protein